MKLFTIAQKNEILKCTPSRVRLPRWLSGKESTCQCRRQVHSLGWEDPLEKEMATHSSILAWRIPWTEEPGGLQSTGSQRVEYSWVTSLSFFLSLTTYCGYTWFYTSVFFHSLLTVCVDDFLSLLYVFLYQWAFSSHIFLSLFMDFFHLEIFVFNLF